MIRSLETDVDTRSKQGLSKRQTSVEEEDIYLNKVGNNNIIQVTFSAGTTLCNEFPKRDVLKTVTDCTDSICSKIL